MELNFNRHKCSKDDNGGSTNRFIPKGFVNESIRANILDDNIKAISGNKKFVYLPSSSGTSPIERYKYNHSLNYPAANLYNGLLTPPRYHDDYSIPRRGDITPPSVRNIHHAITPIPGDGFLMSGGCREPTPISRLMDITPTSRGNDEVHVPRSKDTTLNLSSSDINLHPPKFNDPNFIHHSPGNNRDPNLIYPSSASNFIVNNSRLRIVNSINEIIPPLLHTFGTRVIAMRSPWRLPTKIKSVRNNVSQIIGFLKIFERLCHEYFKDDNDISTLFLSSFYNNVYSNIEYILKLVDDKCLDKRRLVTVGRLMYDLDNFGCDYDTLLYQKFTVWDLSSNNLKLSSEYYDIFSRQIVEYPMNSRGLPSLIYILSCVSSILFWLDFHDKGNHAILNYPMLNFNVLLIFSCITLSTNKNSNIFNIENIILTSFDWRNSCRFKNDDMYTYINRNELENVPKLIPMSSWPSSYKRYLSYYNSLYNTNKVLDIKCYRLKYINFINTFIPGMDFSIEVYNVDIPISNEDLNNIITAKKSCRKYNPILFDKCKCCGDLHDNVQLLSCHEDYRLIVHDIVTHSKVARAKASSEPSSTKGPTYIHSTVPLASTVGLADSSSNYLSQMGKATPGDRGSGEGIVIGPQVEPAADLREAEGQLKGRADGRTTGGRPTGLDEYRYDSDRIFGVGGYDYVTLDYTRGKDGMERNVYLFGDIVIGIVVSSRKLSRRLAATYNFNTCFINGNIDVQRCDLDIWDSNYIVLPQCRINIVLEPVEFSEIGINTVPKLRSPKSDIQAFLNNHIVKVDEAQVHSLMDACSQSYEMCELSLKICNKYGDALEFLINHTKELNIDLTEEFKPISDLRMPEKETKKDAEISGMYSHPLAESSSNYLSLKGRATPGDRGEVKDVTSSGLPVADLREAKGELNKGVDDGICMGKDGSLLEIEEGIEISDGELSMEEDLDVGGRGYTDIKIEKEMDRRLKDNQIFTDVMVPLKDLNFMKYDQQQHTGTKLNIISPTTLIPPPKVTRTNILIESLPTESHTHDVKPEVSNVVSSPPEVQSTSPSLAESSSNLISLKSKATPRDRGGREGVDEIKSSTRPQVEPVADLGEAKGEVNREAVCKTTSGGDGRTSIVKDVDKEIDDTPLVESIRPTVKVDVSIPCKKNVPPVPYKKGTPPPLPPTIIAKGRPPQVPNILSSKLGKNPPPLGIKLHWKTISGTRVQGTIFENMNKDDNKSYFDMGIVKELFGRRDKKPDINDGNEKMELKNKEKEKLYIEILDGKRAQNVGIVLRFPNIEYYDELLNAIDKLDIDSSLITIDNLNKLNISLPNDNEIDKFKIKLKDGNKMNNFRDIEQNILKLISRPKINYKIRILKFLMQYRNIIDKINEQLNIFQNSCNEIEINQQLPILFSAILHYGNFVNHGDIDLLHIQGFTITSAIKLIDFKSSDNQISSLHYLLINLSIKFPSISFNNLDKSLSNVLLAEKTSANGINELLDEIRNEILFLINFSQSIHDTLKKHGDNNLYKRNNDNEPLPTDCNEHNVTLDITPNNDPTSSPSEVSPAVSSSNYLSLKSIATPGDLGGSVGVDGMRSSTGPQVEPVADLREAEGEVNREGTTLSGKESRIVTSGGTANGNDVAVNIKEFDVSSEDMKYIGLSDEELLFMEVVGCGTLPLFEVKRRLDVIIDDCKDGINKATCRRDKIFDSVIQTWKYLGEDYKTTLPLEGIFNILGDLIRSVKRVFNDVQSKPNKFLIAINNEDERNIFINKFMDARTRNKMLKEVQNSGDKSARISTGRSDTVMRSDTKCSENMNEVIPDETK